MRKRIKSGKEAHILRIACLLILEFLQIVSGMNCPIDFIKRSDESCCKPIQCSENQGYNLCSSRNTVGYDACYDCPIGTLNNFPTDTSDIWDSFQEEELCTRKIDCNCAPEAELLNRDECQRTGKKECVCRRQDLRYGDDPLACKGPVTNPKKLSSIRSPGNELKNTGDVGECDQGHFKNKSDDSICIPHTKCPKGFFAIFNGSKSEDRQCQLVTTTLTPSTTTVVKSVTNRLSTWKNLRSNEEEQRNNTAKKNYSNQWFKEYEPIEPSFPVGNNASDQLKPSKTKPENDGQIFLLAFGIAIGALVIILILVAALIKCCLCRRKNKNQHKKDKVMKEFKILEENSDTGHATYVENKDLAEMNPLLTVINETQNEIDNNIGKEDKILKKDDHFGQYTQLLENSFSQSTSSVVSESFSKEKPQEDYDCNNGTDPAEETPVVHVLMKESPMVREKVKEEIQRTDPTILRACCSKPADFDPESGDQQFPYSSPILLHTQSVCPHSTDSLDESDGKYSKLNFGSFGMEDPLMGSSASCQRDSDYETGSSRKNDTYNSELFSSLSFGKEFNSLNVQSFDDSSQLSTETQSSVRTGKSVAVVLPFRGNEMETVDEEETCSKTP